MKGFIALFIFILWLILVVYRDEKKRPGVSFGSWIVLFWIFIHATRPVTMWLGWEIESTRDEGNPAEALVNAILIIVGFTILWQRGIQWQIVVRDNAWLLVFYLFWSLSVVWSDYPLITTKRLLKEFGNVFMVLVVLTEKDPSEAIKAVCVRLAYVCIPWSIILIKYYPSLGRAFAGPHHDLPMYIGVTTQKNMLGVLVFVSVLFLLWDLLELTRRDNASIGKIVFGTHALVLSLCGYLLMLIDSATALVCTIIGVTLLIILRRPSLVNHPGRVEVVGLSVVVVLGLLSLSFDIKQKFLEILGRNPTLTTRTDIWEVVLEYQDNPMGGAGFDTFWAGWRLELLADKTFGIIQAHNGYLETYLNGGLVGVALLVVVLFSAYLRNRKKLVLGRRDYCLKYAIILAACIHNYTEASFNKLGILWFVTSFAIMEYTPREFLKKSIIISRQNR